MVKSFFGGYEEQQVRSSSATTDYSTEQESASFEIEVGQEEEDDIVKTNLPVLPHKRVCSVVSSKYDRNNKGYLDNTELALRRMDSQNRGYLGVDKVYDIMESVQSEQKKSAKLIVELQHIQTRALNLKRSVLALCGLVVMLALANIGTSIAAARLAKDTSISSTMELVVKGTNQRVATTARLVEIVIDPLDDYDVDGGNNSSSRRLWEDNEEYSRLLANSNICNLRGNGQSVCEVQGLINYKQAEQIYKQFCPNWTLDGGRASCGGGESEIILQCGSGRSMLSGGMYLPVNPTVTATDVTFPRKKRGYRGVQMIESDNPSPFGSSLCLQEFTTGMYCLRDDSPCIVMASWDPSCDGPVKLCGEEGYY